jgi:hypothetical protein
MKLWSSKVSWNPCVALKTTCKKFDTVWNVVWRLKAITIFVQATKLKSTKFTTSTGRDQGSAHPDGDHLGREGESGHGLCRCLCHGAGGDAGRKAGDESLGVLNAASGFLRGELGRGLKTRIVPRIRFHFDEVTARGNRMAALITTAVKEDQARATARGDNAPGIADES